MITAATLPRKTVMEAFGRVKVSRNLLPEHRRPAGDPDPRDYLGRRQPRCGNAQERMSGSGSLSSVTFKDVHPAEGVIVVGDGKGATGELNGEAAALPVVGILGELSAISFQFGGAVGKCYWQPRSVLSQRAASARVVICPFRMNLPNW